MSNRYLARPALKADDKPKVTRKWLIVHYGLNRAQRRAAERAGRPKATYINKPYEKGDRR